jgi:AcrR family transcriptional regulator
MLQSRRQSAKDEAMGRRASAATKPDSDTRTALLDAAEACLRENGYSGLSTRRVADAAGMPLSQIHYHFGSKEALMLALLEQQNRRLLERQRATFADHMPLWKRWEKTCDYLDEDIASGYVRVLQEVMALGWSNPDIAAAVRTFLGGWYTLLAGVAKEAAARLGGLGGFKPDEVACLVGNAFLGSEAMILLGFEKEGMPIRRALRRIGTLIRKAEEAHARP